MTGWRHDQQIRERAYQIWEAAGRPEGEALEHWLQAEAEIGRAAARARGLDRTRVGRGRLSARKSSALEAFAGLTRLPN